MNANISNLTRTQKGMSIVELLVAMALGLLLLGGILQVFLSSRQTYSANEAMGRMQENGRFALEFIARSARLAGYIEPTLQIALPMPVIPDSDQCSEIPADKKAQLCSTQGAGNVPDSIGFSFQPPLTDGARRDCLGNTIAANDQLIVNYFGIIPANGTLPASLGCRSYNLTTNAWITGPNLQPLVEGIDSLQVLYGVDSGGDSRSANQYISADRVSNWAKVRSVRIAVLANSVESMDPEPTGRNFFLLDAAPLTLANLGNDKRARQVFTTTIQLKNVE